MTRPRTVFRDLEAEVTPEDLRRVYGGGLSIPASTTGPTPSPTAGRDRLRRTLRGVYARPGS